MMKSKYGIVDTALNVWQFFAAWIVFAYNVKLCLTQEREVIKIFELLLVLRMIRAAFILYYYSIGLYNF